MTLTLPSGRMPSPVPSKICPDRIPPIVAPTPATGPVTVTADAGPDITVRPGTLVSLSARNTAPGVLNTDLTFFWVEIGADASGPVTIVGGNTASPTFTAPLQGSINLLLRQFEVTVTHTSGTTSKDTVTVKTDLTAKDTVVIDNYSRANNQGGTISVAAHTDLVFDPNALMVISVNGAAPQPMTKVGTNTGKFTYTQRSVPAGVPIVVSTRIGTQTFGTASLVGPRRRSVSFLG